MKLFRDGKLTKEEVENFLIPGDLSISIVVTKDDLIRILKRYERGDIDKKFLVDWVNGIWFSDSFVYKEDQSSSIASVMSELEELDETDDEVSKEKISYYIESLNKNDEV